jgi:predicted metalloprotease
MRKWLLAAFVVGSVLALTPAGASAAPNELPTPDAVINWAIKNLNIYWRQEFEGSNLRYRSPVYVHWYNRPGLHWAHVPRACDDWGPRDGWKWMGYSSKYLPNSFYCSVNERLYLDYELFRALLRYDDGRAVVVIAHEWSHHIQHLLVWPEKRRLRQRQFAHFELHADCYAGTFFAWAQNAGELDANDLAHAERALGNFGDPDRTPWYEPRAHGGTSLREEWFLHGFDAASPAACDRIFG